jgi:hypothetical protein
MTKKNSRKQLSVPSTQLLVTVLVFSR